MRILAFTLTFLAAIHAEAGGDKDAKPITPQEAAKMIDKKCTVEMHVKSAGRSKTSFFLNSKDNYKDADNFTAVILKDGAEKFKAAKIEDPSAHFKGKTIRVTGVVGLYQNRPQIVVNDPKQIQVVEKK